MPQASVTAVQVSVTKRACPEISGRDPVLPALSVRNRLPKTATPTAWLSWIAVVSSPLASAACCSGTRTSAWVTSGLNASARDPPSTTRNTCSQSPPDPPPRSTSPTAAYPTAPTAAPHIVRYGCHEAGTRRQKYPHSPNATAHGAKVRPARSAVSPCPACRSTAKLKRNPP